MIVRASDFKDPSIFLDLAMDAQNKGLIPAGPLSFDEGDSVVDLNDLDLDVAVVRR